MGPKTRFALYGVLVFFMLSLYSMIHEQTLLNVVASSPQQAGHKLREEYKSTRPLEKDTVQAPPVTESLSRNPENARQGEPDTQTSTNTVAKVRLPPSHYYDDEGFAWANLVTDEKVLETIPVEDPVRHHCELQMPEDVYVINLPGEFGAERRKVLSENFAKAGIDFKLVAPYSSGRDRWERYSHLQAVMSHPRMESATDFARSKARGQLRSFGEYSLARTHRAIYLDVLARGKQCALVFEDDALVEPLNFRKLLDETLAVLPEDYGVVKLGYGRFKSFNWGSGGVENVSPTIVLQHHRTCCTDAYVVSRRGAWIVAMTNTPTWARADEVLSPRFKDAMGLCEEVGGCGKESSYIGTFKVLPHLVVQNREVKGDGSWREV